MQATASEDATAAGPPASGAACAAAGVCPAGAAAPGVPAGGAGVPAAGVVGWGARGCRNRRGCGRWSRSGPGTARIFIFVRRRERRRGRRRSGSRCAGLPAGRSGRRPGFVPAAGRRGHRRRRWIRRAHGLPHARRRSPRDDAAFLLDGHGHISRRVGRRPRRHLDPSAGVPGRRSGSRRRPGSTAIRHQAEASSRRAA